MKKEEMHAYNLHSYVPNSHSFSKTPMSALPSSNSALRVDLCCPKCGGHLNRTWRRPIDRFLSGFTPLQRYQCESFHCRWEGNRRIDPAELLSCQAQSEAQESARRRKEASLPWSFVVSTSMALASIVAMLAFVFDPSLR